MIGYFLIDARGLDEFAPEFAQCAVVCCAACLRVWDGVCVYRVGLRERCCRILIKMVTCVLLHVCVLSFGAVG